MFVRLVTFTIILLPAFLKAGLDYFAVSNHAHMQGDSILYNVGYGPNDRNFLDIFLPPDFPSAVKNQRSFLQSTLKLVPTVLML